MARFQFQFEYLIETWISILISISIQFNFNTDFDSISTSIWISLLFIIHNLCFLGMAINCQVCGEDGHCRDSEDPGVSTACPEGVNGCFFSDSSKIFVVLCFDSNSHFFRNDDFA